MSKLLDAPPSIVSLAQHLQIGQYKRQCPLCQHTREKHKTDKPLSIRVDGEGVQFSCWHCGQEGGWIHEGKVSVHMPRFDTASLPEIQIPKPTAPVKSQALEYLKSRGIGEAIIEAHTIQGSYQFNGKPVAAIGFPYRPGGKTSAVKWRSADDKKCFSQQNTCEDLYLIDTYVKGNDILICEGEIDALSWLTAGVPDNVTIVSIPNGAPAQVKDGKVDPKDDKRFQYLWRAKAQLDQANRIYLSTDNDGPGRALSEEISRRVDRRKVWITSLGDYKDASEALTLEGARFLRNCFEDSRPLPILGLQVASDFCDQFQELYERGVPRGSPTGITSLDRLMSVSPGMLTVVTGFPGCGKSDLIDQICLNLAVTKGWSTVYCSFEKPVELHMVQLSEKLTGKPFFDGPNTRMSPSDRDYCVGWLNDHFAFMDYRRGAASDIEGILEGASAAVMRMGCRILVIDPYNYISANRGNETETDSINAMLTKVQQWAKAHDCHVFFIAHPAKIGNEYLNKKVIVTGHQVSGSAAWFAKADIGLTVWRDPNDENPPEAHVWKARWSWMGKHGACKLKRDMVNSRWDNFEPEDDHFDWSF